mmetsp:Transcript_26258/g.73304  ORF Transcript_26258/g.73304 Transcript_26258/m.73304 type:complete len:206 (+) Transcript_26258:367-984(+)
MPHKIDRIQLINSFSSELDDVLFSFSDFFVFSITSICRRRRLTCSIARLFLGLKLSVQPSLRFDPSRQFRILCISRCDAAVPMDFVKLLQLSELIVPGCLLGIPRKAQCVKQTHALIGERARFSTLPSLVLLPLPFNPKRQLVVLGIAFASARNGTVTVLGAKFDKLFVLQIPLSRLYRLVPAGNDLLCRFWSILRTGSRSAASL